MKLLLLIPLIGLCASLSAIEYGYLSTKPGPIPHYIQLNNGDVLDIISSYRMTANGNYVQIIGLEPDTVLTNITKVIQYSLIEDGVLFRKLVPSYESVEDLSGYSLAGPLIVCLVSSNASIEGSIGYKLTRASEVEYKQANIVSLPSDTVGAGTHEIVVEASDDLQTWTAVHSSSIGGNKAFFRTRVIQAGN